ncbi:TPA: histidine phosphatase family protein [Candidatus Woesearchaeota archaeon]|nr:histidine phosphatase family protein [Candidatus Woesearchaeota archaeon]
MRIILVRHGETLENKEGIMQGQLPGTLSDLGKEQARLVAERLKDEKIDVIITSDLQRAVDTAEAIAEHHPHLTIELAPGLREWSRGEYEGKKPHELPKHLTGVDLNKNPDFSFPGGESIRDVYNRVKETYNKILERHIDQNVLVVGHGVSIRALMRVVKGISVEGEFDMPSMQNTSVTIFEIGKDGSHEVVCLNCDKHLNQSGL